MKKERQDRIAETLTVETGVRGSGSSFNRLIDCVFLINERINGEGRISA